ncbi:ABC transporter permease [Shewanella maritima]|uniref:ABC transporter permease n=1 Tax=Shewanella maritima TaxID=2520507 RepID=UPI0037358123
MSRSASPNDTIAINSNSRPSMVNHIWQLAKFELTKRFTNKSGMIALIAFLLVWTVIILYPVRSASDILLQPAFKDFITSFLGPNSLNHLFEWQVAEYAVFWAIALYAFPLFSIFISADQFCSDKQRGSFRFLTLRVSRSELFFGRFIGQMLIQAVLISLTLLVTLALVLVRDASLLAPSLMSCVVIFANVLIVLLPYVAVMAVFSLIAKTARQASIFAIVLWAIVSMIITIVNVQFPTLAFLDWLLPGAQISHMVNTQGFNTFSFAPIPILQAIALLILGKVVMQRSAL